MVQTSYPELAESRDTLSSEQVAEEMIPSVVHRLGRVTEIFRLMAQQWSVWKHYLPRFSCFQRWTR